MQGAAAAVTRDGARVEAGPEASQLHSRGFHGTPQPGGALELSWAEAAYLVEVGRLAMMDGAQALPLAQVLERAQARDERFEIRYLVYRDLRERGFVVREEQPAAGVDFTVRDRGATAKAPSKFWVLAASERGEVDPAQIHEWADRAKGLSKVALIAVVDEEGDVTYYEFAAGLDGGAAGASDQVEPQDAILVGDHVLIDGPNAHALHAAPWHFGKPLKQLLRLSLLEATWLVELEKLRVHRGTSEGPNVSYAELRRLSAARAPDFDLKLAAFAELRDLRLVPKTGFKYGVHFRVYASGEGRAHAKFLVHAIPDSQVFAWPELSRAVRLSHGVRKHLAYALVQRGGVVRFLRVRWTRP